MLETQTETMPELVVDRSPELARVPYNSVSPTLKQMFGQMTPAQVTGEDIEEGQRGDGATCAFARAVKRIDPTVTDMNLSGENPSFTRDGVIQALQLHPDIVEWIGKWDRGEPVEPMTFYWG